MSPVLAAALARAEAADAELSFPAVPLPPRVSKTRRTGGRRFGVLWTLNGLGARREQNR